MRKESCGCCGKLVAEIRDGSIRRDTKYLCGTCWKNLQITIEEHSVSKIKSFDQDSFDNAFKSIFGWGK